MVCTTVLVPTHVDDFLKELIIVTSALVVQTINPYQLKLFVTLSHSVEPEVVDDALEITTTDQVVTPCEVLKGVS